MFSLRGSFRIGILLPFDQSGLRRLGSVEEVLDERQEHGDDDGGLQGFLQKTDQIKVISLRTRANSLGR